jgi:hypothetical protein
VGSIEEPSEDAEKLDPRSKSEPFAVPCELEICLAKEGGRSIVDRAKRLIGSTELVMLRSDITYTEILNHISITFRQRFDRLHWPSIKVTPERIDQVHFY